MDLRQTIEERVDAEVARLEGNYASQLEALIRSQFGEVGLRQCDRVKFHQLIHDLVGAAAHQGKRATQAVYLEKKLQEK